MEILFWISAVLIFLAYPGYVLFLCLMSRICSRPVNKKDYQPRVSLIIAAYNEEADIRERIENVLALDYPAGLIQIIVASDCSTDNTDNIVREYQNRGVILNRLEKRGGKTANQNATLAVADGEIIFFTDAGTYYAPDVIQKVVRNFNDPAVGCVGGTMHFVRDKTEQLVTEKKYYTSFDQKLKIYESRIYSIIGVNGPLYAVRRKYCRPLPENLTSDMISPLDVIRQDRRVIYEPEALSLEKIAPSSGSEFRRKVRTVRSGMSAVFAMRALLNPFKYFWPAIFLMGHKILRWLFFIFMAGLFIGNAFMADRAGFYQIVFIFQLIFYGLALIGVVTRKIKSLKPFTIPYYFCLYNLAAAAGFFKFLFGEKTEIWEVER